MGQEMNFRKTPGKKIAVCLHIDLSPEATIAGYFRSKYRQQAANSGYFRAARNLKKQGVPIEIAKLILGVA